ncbi:hypothetical protein JCM8547_008720 [Rhodosporidiobolus lusitaniae]
MDSDSQDNPWGASTPPFAAANKQDGPLSSPPTSPRVSYSPSADERPTWGADEPAKKEKEQQDLEQEEEDKQDEAVTDEVEQDEEDEDKEEVEPAAVQDQHEDEKVDELISAPLDDNEETSAHAPSSPPAETADSPSSSRSASPAPAPADELSPSSSEQPPFTPPTAAVALPLSLPDATPAEAPPMDDFDDDFDSPAAQADAGAPEAEGGDEFDDFDDFDQGGDGAGDDDFGDFGEFGDAAPLDESAFEFTPLPPPVPIVVPSPAPPAASAYPPLRLDLSNTARRAVAPQLKEFCRQVWSEAEESVSEEPERQVEGVAQVLATESTRNLLSDLSTLPQLRPLDWRRSKIRKEHLLAMNIPVNLDDSAEPPRLAPLSIPRTRLSGIGLTPSIHPPSRPSSAPPHSTTLPYSPTSNIPRNSSGSNPPSRSSTPFADRERSRPSNGPPPFDKAHAEELMAIKGEDLTLMSLKRLREIGEEIDRISVEASGVLTHALMLREKEGQDKEVYNEMIQDLVTAAAKMKTSSALGTGRPQPKRQGSGRWGR